MSEEVRPAPLTDLEPRVPTPLAIPYSAELTERICSEYSEGKTLAAICRLPGMPRYQDVTKWLRNVEGFRAAIDQARAARGIILEDMALENIDAIPLKDDVPGERLRFDKLRWAAEVNDPSRYGKKVTHAGDASKPIQFIISTGFPEPNLYQRPPKLGVDGLIEKEVPNERVEQNVVEGAGLGLLGVQTPEGSAGLPQGPAESAGTQDQLPAGIGEYNPAEPWNHPSLRGRQDTAEREA